MSKPFITVAACAVFAALAYVGNADYRDAQAQQAYQCEMIAAGYWPREVNERCEVDK